MGYFMIKDQNLRTKAEKYNLVRKEITTEIFEQKRETRRQKESHGCGETEIKLAQVT